MSRRRQRAKQQAMNVRRRLRTAYVRWFEQPWNIRGPWRARIGLVLGPRRDE